MRRSSAPSGPCVPGPATLGEFRLSDNFDGRIGADWIATLADSTEVVVSDFRGAPSQVGTEKAASVVQSLGYLEPRALQLLVPFTKEAGSWRLVTLDFGAEARRQDCEFLMCFAFQAPNSQLSITSPYVEIGFELLKSEASPPLFILTVKSACGLLGLLPGRTRRAPANGGAQRLGRASS